MNECQFADLINDFTQFLRLSLSEKINCDEFKFEEGDIKYTLKLTKKECENSSELKF